MIRHMPGRRALHLGLIAALLASTSAFARAELDAGMLGTDTALAEARVADHRAQLLTALERDAMRDALVARGVNPEQAAERIERLSEQELALLSEQMDELPAGAGATTVLLVVIILLLILR
ncbi:PA2779 family protein [Isoalcanivorax indicus]|uniref:PA2779 family protein n=1 Tax=Isoalcanivorax indicus TaxID=2202653 RepID=UPI0013C52063|nr:PA2779 family protein [Isoalcanivorax indicus]